MDNEEKLNEKSLKDNCEKYFTYFNSDIDGIKIELEKSQAYSDIIDNEISKFRDTTKGGQHYLTEHIKNAISLQVQRECLRKDLFSIKKTILDYNSKDEGEDINQNELISKIEKMIDEDKKRDARENKTLNTKMNVADLDEDIDRRIREDQLEKMKEEKN